EGVDDAFYDLLVKVIDLKLTDKEHGSMTLPAVRVRLASHPHGKTPKLRGKVPHVEDTVMSLERAAPSRSHDQPPRGRKTVPPCDEFAVAGAPLADRNSKAIPPGSQETQPGLGQVDVEKCDERPIADITPLLEREEHAHRSGEILRPSLSDRKQHIAL